MSVAPISGQMTASFTAAGGAVGGMSADAHQRQKLDALFIASALVLVGIATTFTGPPTG